MTDTEVMTDIDDGICRRSNRYRSCPIKDHNRPPDNSQGQRYHQTEKVGCFTDTSLQGLCVMKSTLVNLQEHLKGPL